jgi:flavin reductase (DIM6/NTAB) family NADH-FMN oxidoreductase RutF
MGDVQVDVLEKMMACLDFPMFVVTTEAGGATAGCLVGFATQASIHPPRFLVGLSTANHTFRIAAGATHLAVHVFGHQDLDIVELFGGRTGDTIDKFAHCRWHAGPAQVPILDDAAGWFVGKIVERFPLGDHVGHLLEPVDGSPPHDPDSWVSLRHVRDLTPGHEA